MQQPDLAKLLSLLQSPAGQQLMDYLKTNGGSAARAAAAQASAGELEAARDTLSPLLENPRLQELLRQLGGNP